jgi:chromosome segregation ATPase
LKQDMSIAKTKAALEATRQKITEQLFMVGRSIQSIDPTLYDKEQELERLLKHLQEVRDAPTRSQELEEMVDNAEEALDKLPDETFIPISNYIDFLKKEHWNANKAAEIEEQEDHNMETYRVGIHFEEGVVLTIKAESKEAAEKIAMDAIEECGGTEYPKKFNQDGVHREFCVTHTEEQDNG